MATKTITITVDAYEALKRQKLPGESFSELINRRFGSGSSAPLRALVGLLTEDEAAAMERGIKQRRRARAARQRRRARGGL